MIISTLPFLNYNNLFIQGFFLSSILLTVGLFGLFINKQSFLITRMSIKFVFLGIVLDAVLNFIFLVTLTQNPSGYIIALFLITIEVVEAAIGLCLFILIHKYFKNTNLLKY